MRNTHTRINGFTLVEVLVALSIMLLTVITAFSAFLFLEQHKAQSLVQTHLDTDTNLAIKRMRYELRLSSLAEVVYYPKGSSRFSAISFPMLKAKTYQLNSSGGLDWDTTVIYHTKQNEDGKTELLRTEFSSRITSMTVTDREKQLEEVVSVGNGKTTLNSNNAETRVLLENVTEWEITKKPNFYDGYSEGFELDVDESLGSFMISPGPNTLTFSVAGQNNNSRGYRIGIDTLRLTASGYDREAEDLTISSSPATERVSDSSEELSGGYFLNFPAANEKETLSVNFYNDRFEETKFDPKFSSGSNVTYNALDTSFSPPEYVLLLNGNSTNWNVISQTSNEDPPNADICFNNARSSIDDWDHFENAAVRVVLRGVGGKVKGNGCRVAFSAAAEGNLEISEAYIDMAAIDPNAVTLSPNTAGIQKQLLFSGNAGIRIPSGETLFSDYIDFPIQPGLAYSVTFKIRNSSGAAHPSLTLDKTGNTSSFVIPGHELAAYDSIPLTLKNWSASTYAVKPQPFVAGVSLLHATYPAEGVYISQVINTQMDAPEFDRVEWTKEYCPAGTSIKVYARADSDPDMENLPWHLLVGSGSAEEVKENPSIPWKRYLQYKVVLKSSPMGVETPKLQKIAFQWPGESRPVDIGGTFINDSNCGQFVAEINGDPLASPLRIDLETENEFNGFGKSVKKLTSSSSIEISPRN